MRNKTIGVISSWSGLSSSISKEARKRGYSVLFHILEMDIIESHRDLESEQLDAYIFISPTKRTIESAEKLYKSGKPVIILLRNSPICPTLTVDSEAACADAVDHLVRLGHTDILFITATGNEQGRVRLNGYLKGLKKNGIPRKDELIVDCYSFGSNQTTEMVSNWLKKGIHATAVLCSNRSQSTDTVSVFLANNYKIPEDLAVATIDEPSVGPEWINTITCWKLPMKELGQQAVQRIDEQFTQPNRPADKLTLDCQRVIRESCGARKEYHRSEQINNNKIICTLPQGITTDSIDDVSRIDSEILNSLKEPSSLAQQLPIHLKQLESLGMDLNEGFKILNRCKSYCHNEFGDTDSPNYTRAFCEAYQAHTRWISNTYYRTEKEREGLARAHLFYPQSLSTDDKPTTLINGLKQLLIARGSTKFTIQLRSWNERDFTYYEWDKSRTNNAKNAVVVTEGKKVTPDKAFLEFEAPAYCGLFNLSEDETLMDWLIVSIPPHQFASIREMALQFASGLQAHILFAKERHKNIELNAALKRAEQERSRSEEARYKAEKATMTKENFLANMSHEMRTPMNGVIGLTYILLESNLNTFQKDRLNMVKDAAAELMTTINNVLDFSKLEAGKLVLESIQFDLWEELGSILLEHHQIAEENDLLFFCRIDPNIPHQLSGDPERLRQIIRSLLNNALKSTTQGYIYLNIYLDSKNENAVGLKFALEDTGIGMSEEQIEKVFQRFENRPLASEQSNTSGLELNIARKIVQQMNGNMWIQSMEGVGTIFFFTASFTSNVNESFKDLASQNHFFSNSRILILDKNGISRNIYKESIALFGASLQAARSRGEALEILKNENLDPFDYCIFDTKKVREKDLNFIQQLSEQKMLKGKLLVILPQKTPDIIYQRLSRIRSVHCLTKPVFTGDLHEKLTAALKVNSVPAIYDKRKRSSGLKILITEDNAVNIEVVRSLLIPRGHKITLAMTGDHAISLYKISQYDLILMDINMPGINGYETTQTIRKLETKSGSHTRILAMTAHNSNETKTRCLEAGMDGFVLKPVQKELFIDAVEIGDGIDLEEIPNISEQDYDAPIDKDSLLNHIGHDKEFLQRMHAALLKSINNNETALHHAIADSDWDQVADLAHSFKSTLGAFGDQLGLKTSSELEHQCRSGNQALIHSLATDVSNQLHTLEKLVEKVLKEEVFNESQ